MHYQQSRGGARSYSDKYSSSSPALNLLSSGINENHQIYSSTVGTDSSMNMKLTSNVEEDYLSSLKKQFFWLGISMGGAIQMFLISTLMLFMVSGKTGPMKELTFVFFPFFRLTFFLSFFWCLYGCTLFIWRRYKIDYFSVLNVSIYHNYTHVLRGSSFIG